MSASSVFLTLRALTQKTFEFFKENKSAFLKKIEKGSGHLPEKNEVYTTDEYLSLLGLVSHKDSNLLAEVWDISLSFFLLKCLDYIGWLPTELGKKLTDDEEYLILMLIHLRRVTQYNTHQVAEMLSTEGGLLKTQEVGMAVRSTAALLNHSCWPNTVRCSKGFSVVIMAAFTIYPGEEVLDIYTESFHDVSKEVRQSKCTHYKFICKCRACLSDWPLLSELPAALHLTPKTGIKERVPMQLVIKLGEQIHCLEQEAREFMKMKNFDGALLKWKEVCELAESFVKHPSRIFIIIRKQIQICLWERCGTKIRKELQQESNSQGGK